MKCNITIDDIIRKISYLDRGTYKKNNFIIKVGHINKFNTTECTANILDGKYIYTIEYFNKYCYYISIKTKEDTEIFYRISPNIDYNKSMIINIDDKSYYMTKTYISLSDTNQHYNINDNCLIKKIDDNCSIGYDLEENKMYVFNKENKYSNNNLTNYTKEEYDFKDDMENQIYNTILEKGMYDLKKLSGNYFYKKLIDMIEIPSLRTDLGSHFKELIEVANIYKKNVDYFSIFDNETLLNELYKFIDGVVMNESDTLINEFKDNVENINLKDIDNLKKLKKDINQIIKERKKYPKRKILKITDIEN